MEYSNKAESGLHRRDLIKGVTAPRPGPARSAYDYECLRSVYQVTMYPVLNLTLHLNPQPEERKLSKIKSKIRIMKIK